MLVTMVPRRSVITVGNFDGVHLAHQALIATARKLAAEAGGADVLAMTFQDHPLTVLKPDRVPPKLMDTPQRMAALLDAGADRIEWVQPDEGVLKLDPRQFVESVVERFKPVGWVEGPDFRFGRGRAGDVQTLHALGSELGFEVRVVDPVRVTLRDKSLCTVSSSLVRWLVGEGRMGDATLCLGRPFTLRGEVVRGEQRGRTIGFPTANLATPGRQLPADGVYAGTVTIHGRAYPAAASVGVKPTFGKHERVFEVFIIGYEGDLYGQTLEVKVLRWLREQWPFPSVESLVEQMNRDVEQTQKLHATGLLDPAGMAVAA